MSVMEQLSALSTLRHVALYEVNASLAQLHTSLYFATSVAHHPYAATAAEWFAHRHRIHLQRAHTHRMAVMPDREAVRADKDRIDNATRQE